MCLLNFSFHTYCACLPSNDEYLVEWKWKGTMDKAVMLVYYMNYPQETRQYKRGLIPEVYCVINSLAKEVLFSVAFVCFSVCLSVSNISQTVMTGLWKKFMEGTWMVQEANNRFWWQSGSPCWHPNQEIWPLLNKLWADFDEIFRKALQWYKEQLIKYLGWPGSWNPGNMVALSCLGQGGLCSLSALVVHAIGFMGTTNILIHSNLSWIFTNLFCIYCPSILPDLICIFSYIRFKHITF